LYSIFYLKCGFSFCVDQIITAAKLEDELQIATREPTRTAGKYEEVALTPF
jgi:hypothetical protein